MGDGDSGGDEGEGRGGDVTIDVYTPEVDHHKGCGWKTLYPH